MQLAMTAQSENILDRLSHWLAERRISLRAVHELEDLDREALFRLAKDSGLTPSDLLAIAANGTYDADEMHLMMRALNIDPTAVELADPAEFHNMQLRCAQCPDKAACRADLENDQASENYLGYCLNANKLNELRAQPDMLAN